MARAAELRAKRGGRPASNLVDEAAAAAARVPGEKRFGSKVFLHHAWAEYRKSGGKLSLSDFKQQLADDPAARLKLGLSRLDMTQTQRPGDVKASGVRSGVAEFNFIRTGSEGSGSKLGNRPIPRTRPESERARAAAAVAAARGKATIGHKPGEKFSLLQRSAEGSRRIENSGRGRTPFMFDMKKGDLKGQTTLMERYGTVETHAKPGKQTQKLQGAPTEIGLKPTRQTPREALASQRKETAARVRTYRAEHLEHSQPHKYGKEGHVYRFGTEHIHFDPERFQFKLGAQGKHGVTDALKDAEKFDLDKAGAISVWRDPADGKVYVVNGHHRLDLANRMGAKQIDAKLLEAPTAEHARAKGALLNIAEGRGTSIDAAKFFREPVKGSGPMTAEHLKREGVSLKESTAKEGLALAGLPERAFRRVVDGEMSAHRAAIIGGSGLSHPQQEVLIKELDRPKNRDLTDGTVRRMVERAKASPTVKEQHTDLFGTSEEEKSLYVHRARLEDAISRSLAADSRLFSHVSKSKAAEALAERGASYIDRETTGAVGKESAAVHGLFEQLAARHPEVSRPLNEAAERLHRGEPFKTVEPETRAKVHQAIKRILEEPGAAFE
jgi:hypothetical protein